MRSYFFLGLSWKASAFLCRLQYSSEHLDVENIVRRELNNTTAGDSIIRCGNVTQCYLDRDVILRMQTEAPNVAIKYTIVILSLYLIGLFSLWLHFVKQKYGQVGVYFCQLPLQRILIWKPAISSFHSMISITNSVKVWKVKLTSLQPIPSLNRWRQRKAKRMTKKMSWPLSDSLRPLHLWLWCRAAII